MEYLTNIFLSNRIFFNELFKTKCLKQSDKIDIKIVRGDCMDELIRNEKGQTEEEFIESYQEEKKSYSAPFVTTDQLIFTVVDDEKSTDGKILKILLVKRRDHPDIMRWALSGGFINMNEDLDKTAERELAEETAVTGIYMEQLYTWGDVNRDKRHRIISVSYMALVNSTNLEVIAGDDAQDADWFTIDYKLVEERKVYTEKGFNKEKYIKVSFTNGVEDAYGIVKVVKIVENGRTKKIIWEQIEKENMAFDHSMVIAYGIERLRSKVDYTDIIFNLMEEKFTWSELKEVYETIQGESKYKDTNFRRKFEQMIIETDEKGSVGGAGKKRGNRPPKLIKFNPEWED